MFPGPNDIVKLIARAFSLTALPVSEQFVILVNFAVHHTPGYELPRGMNLGLGRRVILESSNERDSNASVVVIVGVGALDVPAPALVDEPIAAHQEVVGYVVPAPGLDVEGLSYPDYEDALGLGVAMIGSGVTDYHVNRRTDLQFGGCFVWRLGSPHDPGHHQESTYRWI